MSRKRERTKKSGKIRSKDEIKLRHLVEEEGNLAKIKSKKS